MSRAKGLFITGTDTGVGKTRVTAMLAVALCQHGLRVGVMKPVETGCVVEEDQALRDRYFGEKRQTRRDRGFPSLSRLAGKRETPVRARPSRPSISLIDPAQAQDSFFLRQISGCTAPPEIVTPYLFREPLAPAIAAQHEGQEIDLDHIVRCYEKLAAEYDIVLVEGAGGLLVPLTREASFLDLAARLDLPILVVARNILGTINHTALTVTVASERCQVIGLVLNTVTAELQDASQASNAEALQVWGCAPLLGAIPYVPEITVKSLLEQGECIDLSTLLLTLHLNGV